MPSSQPSEPTAVNENVEAQCPRCLILHRVGRSCPRCRRAKREAWQAALGVGALLAVLTWALAFWKKPDLLFFLTGVILSISPTLAGLFWKSRKDEPAKRRLFLWGALLTAVPWVLLGAQVVYDFMAPRSAKEMLDPPSQGLPWFISIAAAPLIWAAAISITAVTIITWKRAQDEDDL